MISFSSPYVCLRPPSGFPNGFVMISYGFLTASCCLSMVPYVFLSVRMFVWFSCDFSSDFYDSRWFSLSCSLFMILNDSSMIVLEFSIFLCWHNGFLIDCRTFSMVFLWIVSLSYRDAMLSFEYDMIQLRFSYGFPFVFLSVPMVFLWSSFGSPMVFIWFC